MPETRPIARPLDEVDHPTFRRLITAYYDEVPIEIFGELWKVKEMYYSIDDGISTVRFWLTIVNFPDEGPSGNTIEDGIGCQLMLSCRSLRPDKWLPLL